MIAFLHKKPGLTILLFYVIFVIAWLVGHIYLTTTLDLQGRAAERLDVVRQYPLDCIEVIVHGALHCRTGFPLNGYTAGHEKSSPAFSGAEASTMLTTRT